MAKVFNVTAVCRPEKHYMVNLDKRLAGIKKMIDDGQYFTINRARQYGKTTTLQALEKYLENDYIVISLDFQMLGSGEFKDESTFSMSFAKLFLDEFKFRNPVFSDDIKEKINHLSEMMVNEKGFMLRALFENLSSICGACDKPVVLMIDEVDSASNNQVFLDFLAQLRVYYIRRYRQAVFQSVILAGVHDIKNIKRKLRPDEEHSLNSPWNIAADFLVRMSFSVDDISGMLQEYEGDYHTGMDVVMIASLIYDYTYGYPFLVSKICKLIDERIAGSEGFPDKKSVWTKNGFMEAVKLLLFEKNTLFESLMGKLVGNAEIAKVVYVILFSGDRVVYSLDEPWIDVAAMFGFIRNDGGCIRISNRIFEMRLYNYFLATTDAQSSEIFQTAAQNKNQFIRNGRLDMDVVLNKFVQYFDDIYGDNAEPFDEEEGRRRFLLYLRPIINGTGNYYIEAETRNDRRMDVVIDYLGEQFIIELKIWRGNAYNERGEQQISDYLDYFHIKKGYMLSYNFNKNKQTGVHEVQLGNRTIVEAVV